MGCLGTRDATFTALNKDNEYGPPTLNTAPTLEDYSYELERGRSVGPDYKKKLVYATHYSKTNLDEEEAELGKDIQSPNFSNYDDKSGSILETKFAYQLARYYTFDSRTTRYFAQTSYRAGERAVTSIR